VKSSLLSLKTNPEIGIDLRSEVSEVCVLNRADIAIARIVDENVETSKSVDSGLDGIGGCTRICHVKSDGANPVTVAFHQIFKLRRVARRGGKFVPPRSGG
jgi:hypothetical protein